MKKEDGLLRVDPCHPFAAHNSVFPADTETPGGQEIPGVRSEYRQLSEG